MHNPGILRTIKSLSGGNSLLLSPETLMNRGAYYPVEFMNSIHPRILFGAWFVYFSTFIWSESVCIVLLF